MPRKRKPKSLVAWKSFAADILRWIRSDRDFLGSEMSEDIMPILERHGLAEFIPYDPKVHGEIDDVEPGDPFWHFTREARKYRRRA